MVVFSFILVLLLLQWPSSSSFSILPDRYYRLKSRHLIRKCYRSVPSRKMRTTGVTDSHEFVRLGSTRKAEEHSSWTLQEDWALMDGVRQFSVGEGSQVRTFWTQLSTSTPELANKSATVDLLQQRYNQVLFGVNATIPAGDSPPVLEQWALSDNSSSGGNIKFTGNLNGRIIWFVSQMTGRLDDSSLSLLSSAASSNSELMEGPGPGGFVEAMGGRIYELGDPRQINVSNDDKFVADAGNNNAEKTNIFTTSATAFISTLAAAAIFSSASGFGGGLSISGQMTSSGIQQTVVQQQQQKLPSSSTRAIVRVNSASTSEKRATIEARVLREQRIIQTIEGKLVEDRSLLKQFRKEETAAGKNAATASVTTATGKVEISPSEKRSRTEARVLREERRMDILSKQLSEDSIQLKELRQLEKQ